MISVNQPRSGSGRSDGEEVQEHFRATVLVVDDTPNFGMLIKKALGYRQINVRLARNLFEAQAIAKSSSQSIHAAVVEITLQQDDGVKVFDALREIRPDLPVCFVTGYLHRRSVMDLFEMGASHYLQKPFQLGSLVSTVEQLVRNAV